MWLARQQAQQEQDHVIRAVSLMWDEATQKLQAVLTAAAYSNGNDAAASMLVRSRVPPGGVREGLGGVLGRNLHGAGKKKGWSLEEPPPFGGKIDSKRLLRRLPGAQLRLPNRENRFQNGVQQ